ncbi:hypothetical protein DH2020_000893 [Rehmannia glutinosa]|uniref:Sugar phosphate transporter domain-containing protein n=1 Tax=Rehmannia glutinosa TaxID=99300 RepID=A0ABR0XXW2_REHGL
MKTPNNNDDIDVETGKSGKDIEKAMRSRRILTVRNPALLSGLAYCFSSCSMILVNKYVLSSYDFNAGISLMLYQNFVSVVIVSILSFLGIITTEPLTWRLIKVWLPVNFIFVGMLVTSMFSLKYINVAMVTVLKNVTNVMTAVGEMYLFNKHHDNRVWAALFLMIISAISGGITDLSFHAIGYTWQFINCFLTASYSLTLRRVMDTAKQVTKSGDLNEFSMWILGFGNQLHIDVVSPSNRGYYIQPCRVAEQNTSFSSWYPPFQSPNKFGKFCKHILRIVGRSAFRTSENAIKISVLKGLRITNEQ